jgi:ferredoxin-NADP reductase
MARILARRAIGAFPMLELQLRVAALAWEAEDVLRVDLRALDGSPLPSYEPGAHVHVTLAAGLTRSYSLIDGNPGLAPTRYRIGVALDARSRGGSSHVHRQLRPGQIVTASTPRNHFPLVEASPFTQFVAGGIGITPLMAMAERLESIGRPWRLLWCVRTRARAPFLDRLERHAGKVELHVDAERGGPWTGWSTLIDALPAQAHVYCCGPAPMLEAYEAAASVLDPDRVHLERFAAAPATIHAQAGGAFVVHMAKTGKSVQVGAQQSVLDALLAEQPGLPHSCLQGICGVCETRVLDGIPDHRDSVLSKEERASNQTMMICCSRARTAELVLDL